MAPVAPVSSRKKPYPASPPSAIAAHVLPVALRFTRATHGPLTYVALANSAASCAPLLVSSIMSPPVNDVSPANAVNPVRLLFAVVLATNVHIGGLCDEPPAAVFVTENLLFGVLQGAVKNTG